MNTYFGVDAELKVFRFGCTDWRNQWFSRLVLGDVRGAHHLLLLGIYPFETATPMVVSKVQEEASSRTGIGLLCRSLRLQNLIGKTTTSVR